MTDGTTLTDEQGTIRIGDREVRRMGFGAMRLCGPGIWGPPSDRDEALRVLRDAVDWGVTLIDTADAYGPDVDEELIAEALHPYPDDLLIATKGGLTRPSREAWTPDGRPAHLRAACEGSLRRLQLEVIDLYQLHSPDPEVPFAESVGALAELRQAGKIRQVGLSNVTVEQLEEAEGIVPIAAVQDEYSLLDREHDDVVDACADRGLAFLAYRPLGGGDVANDTTSAVAGVAERLDATASQVALAWLLHRSPAIVPIPGTADRRHLAEDLEAARLQLDEADVAAIAQNAR